MDPASAILEMGRALLLTAGLSQCETGGTTYFAGGGKAGAHVLVLVHGVNDQAGTWAPIAAKLSTDYRLIIPDLPGHGGSEPRSGPLSLPFMVERLHAVIEKEGAGKVTLVGNSMGAWISMLYVLDHPERVERLVLESGGGLAIAPGVPLTAKTREEAERILHAVHGPDAPITAWAIDSVLKLRADSPFLRVIASNVFPHFLDARLAEIKVPTTLVWGENDGVILWPYVEKLKKGIAGARVEVIKGAAHIPHAQQPDRVIEILKATF